MPEIALQVDVSLVLTLHREGEYLSRALASLMEATDSPAIKN
jgi:hypothetical protein